MAKVKKIVKKGEVKNPDGSVTKFPGKEQLLKPSIRSKATMLKAKLDSSSAFLSIEDALPPPPPLPPQPQEEFPQEGQPQEGQPQDQEGQPQEELPQDQEDDSPASLEEDHLDHLISKLFDAGYREEDIQDILSGKKEFPQDVEEEGSHESRVDLLNKQKGPSPDEPAEEKM